MVIIVMTVIMMTMDMSATSVIGSLIHLVRSDIIVTRNIMLSLLSRIVTVKEVGSITHLLLIDLLKNLNSVKSKCGV